MGRRVFNNGRVIGEPLQLTVNKIRVFAKYRRYCVGLFMFRQQPVKYKDERRGGQR